MGSQYRIVVVEPSPIITMGLSAILSGSEFVVVDHCSDIKSLECLLLNGTEYDIAVVNPCLIVQFCQSNVKSLIPSVPICISILYQYCNPKTTHYFDGQIDILDQPESILSNLRTVVGSFRKPITDIKDDSAELSEREKEILVSLAKGLTNKAIAERHFISVHTVASHRKNISRKTGIKTVSGLTIYAMFNNLISESDL